MLLHLSGGDAVKHVRVHHVPNFNGARDVDDPKLAVTQ
jgi:hypothetical protein